MVIPFLAAIPGLLSALGSGAAAGAGAVGSGLAGLGGAAASGLGAAGSGLAGLGGAAIKGVGSIGGLAGKMLPGIGSSEIAEGASQGNMLKDIGNVASRFAGSKFGGSALQGLGNSFGSNLGSGLFGQDESAQEAFLRSLQGGVPQIQTNNVGSGVFQAPAIGRRFN